MSGICVGVDVGGTTVKIGFFNVDGTVISKFEIPTRKEDSGKNVLPDIADAINNEIAKNNIDKAEVVGIGIGVPGPVLDDGTVNNCVNVGWGVINVATELKSLTGIEVKVGNDATVAALGEAWMGSGKGCDNLVLITLGTGVGGGVIVGGKVINGVNGAGGEIGHMFVIPDETAQCNCGKCGCLEQAASATGIVRQTTKLLASSDRESKLRAISDFTAKDVFDAAKENDAVALEAVDILGKYLGIAMSHIACVIDPEVFVIGGGVSKAGDILINAVESHFRENAFHASRGAKITIATLGNDAGIYGAARLVLDKGI